MENLNPAIALVTGIVLGAVIMGLIWAVFKARTAKAHDKAIGEAEREKATLAERLLAREQQVLLLNTSLQQEQLEVTRLNEALRTETAKLNELWRTESTERSREAQKALLLESRVEELDAEVTSQKTSFASLQAENAGLMAQVVERDTRLEEKDKLVEEERAILAKAEQALTHTFKALSADALKSNNQSFIELANASFEKLQQASRGDLESRQKAIEEIIKPVRESLDKVDLQVKEIEKERTTAYVSLTEQVKSLASTHIQLQSETSSLVKALRAPNVRGRWGEIQLKRVVELAGMLEYCDFVQQETADTGDARQRPDLTIRLPTGRTIVVDAKVPWDAFYDSLSVVDEDLRRAKLVDHSRLVRNHIGSLSKKSYWETFQPTPEFVLMFLPSETFYSAALEHDPKLIEEGVEKNVILATPTSLIALLKAVAYGWRQEKMTENARKVSRLGGELYERLAQTAIYLRGLGKSLDKSVESYNKAIGSIESRVLVSGRRFKEYRVVADSNVEIEQLEPLEHTTREFQAAEMTGTLQEVETDTPLLLVSSPEAREEPGT